MTKEEFTLTDILFIEFFWVILIGYAITVIAYEVLYNIYYYASKALQKILKIRYFLLKPF